MILVCLVFLALLAVGVPVAVTVGLARYVGALIAAPAPLAVTVQTILHQVDSFVLLSLPLFILAGALMETGGIAHRLAGSAWRWWPRSTSSPASPAPRWRTSPRWPRPPSRAWYARATAGSWRWRW